MFDESGCKPSTIWVDKGSELYSRPIKSCMHGTDIEIILVYKEGESVADEWFNKTLNDKIYK